MGYVTVPCPRLTDARSFAMLSAVALQGRPSSGQLPTATVGGAGRVNTNSSRRQLPLATPVAILLRKKEITMGTTMTLRNGSEEWVTRCYFPTSERLASLGVAIGWLDENENLIEQVPDRLNQRYAVRSPDGHVWISGPLFARGFEVLSLEDALRLGFTTSEYQAAIRHRLLTSELIQTEEGLMAEQIAPRDEVEAICREGAYTDWDEASEARRVPYPCEEDFAGYEIVGWADGEPQDRLRSEYLIKDLSNNEVRPSEVYLCEIGIESLSIGDACRLGFTTSEYHAALRTRILERRHIQDEEDLLASVYPPLEVRFGLEDHGRIWSYRLEEGELWSHEGWQRNEIMREWLLRRSRAELDSPDRLVLSTGF